MPGDMTRLVSSEENKDLPLSSYNTLGSDSDISRSPNESGFMVNKRAMYEPGAVMVCSQKRACCVVSMGFAAIIAVALIVAFTKPGCPEATYIGEPVPGFSSRPTHSPPTTPPTATNGEEFPWTDVRLPFHVRPLYYNISLHPNLTTRHVEGHVTIKLTAIEETTAIIIHGHDLNITDYSLNKKYGKPIEILKFLVYPPHQQLYLGLNEILRRGSNYTLRLKYKTTLKEGLEGFYLSSYINADGERRYLATTHFEPTSARAAFPCFDEPHMKAQFFLSLVREPQHIALFNMPLQDSVPLQDTGLVMDSFEESKIMSTYLVAFVVCDYKSVSNMTRHNISLSVYAPPTMIDQAGYALQVASHIFDFYQDFFGIKYPLPKQDLIAIPDFGAGAMENWGLITYRETALMFDANHTSSWAQQGVAVVIAHELAHQWFGNLVTMSWWSDLWLNEGFASFMENIGTKAAQPGWAMEEQFLVDKMQPALALDALLASHPISTPVKDPAQIESIFDTISYKKGASIISMLESFIGHKMLAEGLQLYLRENEFGNAATDDLWAALTKVTKKHNNELDIKGIMDTWTLQAGFPLVSVTLQDGHILATQARFVVCEENVTDPNEPLNTTIGYRWHVPLTYITSEQPHEQAMHWMNLSDVEFEVGKDVKWVKFNVGQRGFFRVSYDAAGWAGLISLLRNNHTALSSADRANLVDDIFTLVKAGTINGSLALELSLYLKNETRYIPWHTALEHLFQWVRLLFNYPAHTQMLQYIHTLIIPHYKRIGWNNTGTHLERLLRSKILSAAVYCGDTHAIQEAKRMFHDWRINGTFIHPNLRAVVYRTGVRYGTEEDWRHCWKVYNTSTIPSEKKLMLKAMAQTQNPWLMQQFLEYTLDSTKIRQQDVLTVLQEVSKNPSGRFPAWRMVRQHWAQISRQFGQGSFTIGSIIKAVTSTFTSAFDLGEVESFFKDVSVGSGERALAQALETIRLHIQWHEHNLDDVSHWLNQRVTPAKTQVEVDPQ
ncbi:endoplasmic reticulum aminopeptidase 1-like isoform X2 [Portunus trituberculatus]|uniref:endoplasmic reticulum aminopeptidase 1-like isoform X2 n=1 Tax=Portunus trituberculatus TaxID=210409 RepID=UPI001E1CE639|nr:endoplasmic reticulum aminopeptidase 1-like isoform X2 [Portunus trituberculatus]